MGEKKKSKHDLQIKAAAIERFFLLISASSHEIDSESSKVMVLHTEGVFKIIKKKVSSAGFC